MLFEAVTLSCFSTSALLVTGLSKTIETGIATPTVLPLGMLIETLFTLSAALVLNCAVALWLSVFWASTLYSAPGAALRSEVQVLPSSDIFPGSSAPLASVTFTCASLPSAMVTVTGSPAFT